MTVGEFCNREVVVATRDLDIFSVARLMRQHHVGDVVIVDTANPDTTLPVGIVTDRDIVLELVAGEVPLGAVNAGDVMSGELVTAHEHDSLWNTLQRMRAFGVRRMVVVNNRGGLEGILTADDLVELLADELGALARIPFRSREKEKERRE